jgi:hypothetical protein
VLYNFLVSLCKKEILSARKISRGKNGFECARKLFRGFCGIEACFNFDPHPSDGERRFKKLCTILVLSDEST